MDLNGDHTPGGFVDRVWVDRLGGDAEDLEADDGDCC